MIGAIAKGLYLLLYSIAIRTLMQSAIKMYIGV